MRQLLDRRPIILALAGPNGAGKTTFYRAFLAASGLRFVNADVVARELHVDPYRAAKLAEVLRRQLVAQKESFIFETVFSDPVGDKLDFLKYGEQCGYTVVLFFIGIDGPGICDERVAMRVLNGGHDVPAEKIIERFPRVMSNLKRALAELSNVRVYDNSELRNPFRRVATVEKWKGRGLMLSEPTPAWLGPLLPSQ